MRMDKEVITYDITDQPVRVVDSQRWVRVQFDDVFIANSTETKLLIDYTSGVGIQYFFPATDVKMEYLTEVDAGGKYKLWDISTDNAISERAGYAYREVPDDRGELEGYLTFRWESVDNWYEEEEQLIAHPRNLFHRVDPIPSSRRVRVELDGRVLAESEQLYLCFETGLPIRYYFDQSDVNMELLESTEKQTKCPYKGIATYWSAVLDNTTHDNIAWTYNEPYREAINIAECIAFYNERVDIYVNGELQPRPKIIYS